MSIVLWGEEAERPQLESIARGLKKLQKEQQLKISDIRICTDDFESYYGKEFAAAEILFVYFSVVGEAFCRFLISHRRYTEKTIFLFGQSYGCFDPVQMKNYYRVSGESYLLITDPADYFYQAGLKQLLCLIEKKRSMNACAQAG